ncbi:hypothetical protein SteCoe_26956 [Stentor coeruleus]|uniref:Uncharacterized protein n=1 Tax=Stentor coeruleus TaxID=5963 RepID=A0A1R2BBJ0_9CILI|nr:hypothetical protein SteCoe_26956 [Stentor coeruleus]
MLKASVKNSDLHCSIPLNNSFQKTLNRDRSISIQRTKKSNREGSYDFSTSQVKPSYLPKADNPTSSLPSGVAKVGMKRILTKDLECKLKSALANITKKKITTIKREKENKDTENLFTSLLIIFADIDHTISLKGLKINSFQTMMNYVSVPERMEKVMEKIEYCIKHCKVSEKTIFTSFSIFLNISPESLLHSRAFYMLLSAIFECCGMKVKEDIKPPPKKVFQSDLKNQRSLLLAQSLLEIIKTPSKTKKNTLRPLEMRNTEESEETCIINTEESCIGNTVIFEDSDFAIENKVRPPRISQKYIDSKVNNSRSLSDCTYMFKPYP